jgi:D-alanine transaminase
MVPHREASVSIDDRGYQFADGVYEVIAVHRGRLIEEALHFERLARSLDELRIAAPMTERPLGVVLRRVIAANRVRDGIVYLQITRGVAPRDHAFPTHGNPQLVVTARRSRPVSPLTLRDGARVVSIADERWARCDIKSISLLPNILGKQRAKEAGAFEAWQIDRDGNVTEGTSSNAWIVTSRGELVTRPATNAILNGITRRVVIAQALESGLTLVERVFSLEEAKQAREAFMTSTTAFVLGITQIDEAVIGNGRPGFFTETLRARYLRHLEDDCGVPA